MIGSLFQLHSNIEETDVAVSIGTFQRERQSSRFVLATLQAEN